MTPAWVAPDSLLSACHRRFPTGRAWAGLIRLWRVEVALRPADSLIADWVRRAGGDAGRFGLPDAIAAAVRSGVPGPRRRFALLELPGGWHYLDGEPPAFDPWPDGIAEVPSEVRAPTADALGFTGHWRSIPVVSAEAVRAVVVIGDVAEVFAVGPDDSLPDQPLASVPAAAFPAA
jgi:hypothetical protein